MFWGKVSISFWPVTFQTSPGTKFDGTSTALHTDIQHTDTHQFLSVRALVAPMDRLLNNQKGKIWITVCPYSVQYHSVCYKPYVAFHTATDPQTRSFLCYHRFVFCIFCWVFPFTFPKVFPFHCVAISYEWKNWFVNQVLYYK